MRLRPYQLDVVNRVHQAWGEGKRCPVMVMGTGTGKCLATGTPVRMFDGSVRPVEDVAVGDRVMGPDSHPRLVTSVTNGREEMYLITQQGADAYTVNGSHILSLRHAATGRVRNIPLLHFGALSLREQREFVGWSVPGVLSGDLSTRLHALSVSPIGVGEYYGFTLAGPDRLFLLGDFTVTHNTATLSHIVAHEQKPSLVMAHRQELVGQLSLTLAKYGVRHRIIAPDATRRQIEALHVRHLGRRWIDPHAPVATAGVHTLVRCKPDAFLKSVDLIIPDEFHHTLRENLWGRAIQMLPGSARILGPTATPLRADGKGLGIHADGFADELILGPSMRDSINSGMLTDYRIFCPPTGNLDLSQVATSAGGDFSPKPLAEAVHKSSIVGDVVGSYLRIAPGKRGITFAVDLEHAREICAEYKAKGVPAAVLSADSDTAYRAQVMRDFEAGTLLQLVNVDILGEGVDVPACEVVSFARPTQSFGLYAQQFGRAIRLMIEAMLMGRWGDMTDGERLAHIAASVKPVAYIIDHVGNVLRHGLPDAPRRWSLDRREKRGQSKGPSDAIPLRVCLNDVGGYPCAMPYERTLAACPQCGHTPVPAGRSRPEEVDGDLYELDASTLAALRGEAQRIMAPALIPQHLDNVAAMALRKRHSERQQAQGRLGDAIAWWAGWQNVQGRDDREAYRRFFFAFGVDVATARTLNRADADTLAQQIEGVLLDAGVALCNT